MSIIWKATLHMTLWGILAGLVLGVLYGSAFALIVSWFPSLSFGLVFGTAYGGIVGAGMGIITGIILGIVTVVGFNPLTDAAKYRWTTRTVCGVIGFVGSWLGFALLLSRSVDPAFGTIPALIASLASAYTADRFAVCYAEAKRQSAKFKNDDKPKRGEVYG